MSISDFNRGLLSAALSGLLSLPASALADGVVGEHVKDLQGHLDEYQEEVVWLIGQVDGIVDAYDEGGLAAARPEAVVDHWEAVDFHAAIETNYVPLYASIWQGLFGVRLAIENEEPVEAVRAQQAQLEQVLWQSLGAVRLAAQYQQQGLTTAKPDAEATTPVATLDAVKHALDRVVAKYAERLGDEAIGIVHDTYLNRFEGVEGALIEQDAALVEDLEIDFNVTLPQAIQQQASVDEVRGIVGSMKTKLDRAKTLLEQAEQERSEVF